MYEDFKVVLLCLIGPQLIQLNTMHIDVYLRQSYRTLINKSYLMSDQKILDLPYALKMLALAQNTIVVEFKLKEIKKVFHLAKFSEARFKDFRDKIYT